MKRSKQDIADALELYDALNRIEKVYCVSGIRIDTSLPFSWYVVGPDGEVAYCQTSDGKRHAEMIAAALNDRVAMCKVQPSKVAA